MFPTPVHPWQVPGVPAGVEVFAKRDDLSGMQLSGNKVRCSRPWGDGNAYTEVWVGAGGPREGDHPWEEPAHLEDADLTVDEAGAAEEVVGGHLPGLRRRLRVPLGYPGH